MFERGRRPDNMSLEEQEVEEMDEEEERVTEERGGTSAEETVDSICGLSKNAAEVSSAYSMRNCTC